MFDSRVSYLIVFLLNWSQALRRRESVGPIELNYCDNDSFTVHAEDSAHVAFQEAMRPICEVSGLQDLMKVTIGSSYVPNYMKYYDATGFTDQGVVGFFYIKGGVTNNDYVKLMENWLIGAGMVTKAPLLAFHVGPYEQYEELMKMWSPERFPSLVLFNTKNNTAIPRNSGLNKRSDHMHKLRTLMLSRARTGIIVDTDEMMLPVRGGIDKLLKRIPEESNADYPYPILQVHWMSRDPRSNPNEKYYHCYDWHCTEEGCGDQRQRWSQANVVTWGAEALPFASKAWLDYMEEKGPAKQWKTTQDEPTFNLHLWHANATKQWCRFDLPGLHMRSHQDLHALSKAIDMQSLQQHWPDTFWYPKGIPSAHIMSHDIKRLNESNTLMSFLQADEWQEDTQWFYDGKRWTGTEFMEQHPNFPCKVF